MIGAEIDQAINLQSIELTRHLASLLPTSGTFVDLGSDSRSALHGFEARFRNILMLDRRVPSLPRPPGKDSTFVQADYRDLPLRSSSVAGLIARFTLHDVAFENLDMISLFAEWRRVTQSHISKLVICDWAWPPHENDMYQGISRLFGTSVSREDRRYAAADLPQIASQLRRNRWSIERANTHNFDWAWRGSAEMLERSLFVTSSTYRRLVVRQEREQAARQAVVAFVRPNLTDFKSAIALLVASPA